MKFEGGVWEYSKNFSLNEKLLACALYKAAERSINTRNLVWRGIGNIRISGLIQALNLSDDMISNAQVSKTVWENMSKENRAQIFYSLIDLKDLIDIQLESEAFVNHIARLGMTKEKFREMMEWRLDFLIMDVEREIGTTVCYNIKERTVHIFD